MVDLTSRDGAVALCIALSKSFHTNTKVARSSMNCTLYVYFTMCLRIVYGIWGKKSSERGVFKICHIICDILNLQPYFVNDGGYFVYKFLTMIAKFNNA